MASAYTSHSAILNAHSVAAAGNRCSNATSCMLVWEKKGVMPLAGNVAAASGLISMSLVERSMMNRGIWGQDYLFFSRRSMMLGVGAGDSFRRKGLSTTIRAVGGRQSRQVEGDLAVVDKKPEKPFQWPVSTNPTICILGGGFGGLYTALRLESLTWAPDKRPQVLLVDRSERFVFKPMLYEILSKEVDEWEIAPTFTELLSSTNIKFIKGTVKAVSPYDPKKPVASARKSPGGTVFLDGAQIDYDWLVLALGAESKLNLVPGALEFALPFSTLEDALEVDKRLVALERRRFGLEDSPIEVVIVGSGYSGVELAATLAERLGNKGQVRIVDSNPEICASASAGNREAASRVLLSRGVQLELSQFVTSIKQDGSTSGHAAQGKVVVEFKPATERDTQGSTGGRQLKADLVLWTTGTKPTVPSGTDSSCVPFPVNARGQADTDETLGVKGYPRIFAIGDSAGAKDSSGRLLPTTAQVAFQQADNAGWNLWAAINKRPLVPFRYQHLGEMMTLGTTDAAVSVGFIDNLTLDGLLGHAARKLAYLYRLPKDDHKAKVALSWLAKSTISSLSFINDQLTKVTSSK